MSKQFYSFADGFKIGDPAINEWLWNLRQRVLEGADYVDCSSGDTCVSMMAWPTLIEFTVATSDGYASIKFADLDEVRDWTPQFKRAILNPSRPDSIFDPRHPDHDLVNMRIPPIA